jgi:CubicO group peptidase (beta-lactamase class C family)
VPNECRSAPARGGAGLYSTADDFLALLRVLLNRGAASGHRLLAPETVAALARNQVGSLPVIRQRSASPALSDDFLFMDGTQRFGFGVLIESRARASGRPAGSYGWGGLYNTYFWVDPAAELGAVVMMQVSPFSRPACLEVCERFERAVFLALAGD